MGAVMDCLLEHLGTSLMIVTSLKLEAVTSCCSVVQCGLFDLLHDLDVICLRTDIFVSGLPHGIEVDISPGEAFIINQRARNARHTSGRWMVTKIVSPCPHDWSSLVICSTLSTFIHRFVG